MPAEVARWDDTQGGGRRAPNRASGCAPPRQFHDPTKNASSPLLRPLLQRLEAMGEEARGHEASQMDVEPWSVSTEATDVRPADAANARARSRKASPLPKAPQGQVVAQRLLRNSSIRPVQRFDSADYFLSQYNDHQKAEAARVAMSARRIPLDSHLSQPGSPPHPTSARFPVLGQREPPAPSRLTVAHSCKVGASSLAPDPTTSSKLAPAAPR